MKNISTDSDKSEHYVGEGFCGEFVNRQDLLLIREESKLENTAEKAVIILMPVIGIVGRQFYVGFPLVFISFEQRY